MSNELLKDIAAGTTATGTFASTSGGSGIHTASENGNGGLLNPEQSARFLDYMFDATVIGKVARTVRMKSDTTEIDRIGVGEKLMKLATEGSDTATNSAVTFSKISLTTKKLRLDWELSTESLEDNIEGPDLEDHIARLLATQAGNDIEDVILNGNTALTGDALYKAFNGVVKKAKTYGHVVDAGGANITRAVFNSALKFKSQGVDLARAMLANISNVKPNSQGVYSPNTYNNPYKINYGYGDEDISWLL